jgi:leucyl-tRNA synthetase
VKHFDAKKIINHARVLRSEMTESEKVLWKELRGRRLGGFKFLRQHPLLYHGNLLKYNYFIADFYCSQKKAVIELDGYVHNSQKAYDEYRDNELKTMGYNILRIRNEELTDISAAKSKILTFLSSIN